MARKAKVGREKDPDLDRIRALRPDLVLANVEENRREVVETLRAEGVAVWVVFPRSVAEGIALVRELGEVTGTAEAAAPLARALEARYAEVAGRAAVGPRLRVFCPIWRDPYMTIARDTYVHSDKVLGKVREKAPHFLVASFPGALHEVDNEVPAIAGAMRKAVVGFLTTLR